MIDSTASHLRRRITSILVCDDLLNISVLVQGRSSIALCQGIISLLDVPFVNGRRCADGHGKYWDASDAELINYMRFRAQCEIRSCLQQL